MNCLSKDKLQLYIEGEVSKLESSIIRDHLLTCESCNQKYSQLKFFEELLKEPQLLEPPDFITKRVMDKINNKRSYWLSICLTISLLFVTAISWLYIYFDFGSNEALQILRGGRGVVSSIIDSVIDFAGSVFTFAYSFYKIVNKILQLVLPVQITYFISSMIFIIPIAFGLIYLYRNVKQREGNKH